MNKPIRLLLAAAATAGLLALSHAASAAPPEGKGGKAEKGQSEGRGGKGKHADHGHDDKGGSSAKAGGGEVRVSISSGDARRIATRHRVSGYDSLPPGIRKNLARGKPIPPGLAHRAVPPEVLVELPVYPDHEWRVYGSDLVLVAIATAVIVDVLVDVFD